MPPGAGHQDQIPGDCPGALPRPGHLLHRACSRCPRGIKQAGHQFAGGLLAGTAHQIGPSRWRASMPSSRPDLAKTLLLVPPAISPAKASTSVLVVAN